MQKALPLLNDGASVILTGSTAATVGSEAFGVCGASKAAVRSFARTWANEPKGRGIRVSAVVPGPIETPGLNGLAPDDEQAADLRDQLAGTVPLGRMGRPKEVASAALFLATAESSFVTGTEIYVDGGADQAWEVRARQPAAFGGRAPSPATGTGRRDTVASGRSGRRGDDA
ncbi:hypothetical protein GCM10010358_42470 [Streptomyces minutiscleroticus]|uniref:Oxidoreductase n=1 Tax=Streptomyces minutiscleroticus TaxID=68238 RepID=A0A918U2V5_9ACTN|nr:hypothetical protein GCM10010358_42470 [Streptomyces minutiscleroticus]